jgi:hypothetical protein
MESRRKHWAKTKAPRLATLAFQACALLSVLACHRSPVLSRYGVAMPTFPDQCEGGLHPGVDFRAPINSPVIASADGVVASVRETKTGGGVVVLRHQEFRRYTAYAHVQWKTARPVVGQRVLRGQVIGQVGKYRNTGPTPHIHLELCTTACTWGHPECRLEGTEDPLGIARSCFKLDAHYPTTDLVLTYPVPCYKSQRLGPPNWALAVQREPP